MVFRVGQKVVCISVPELLPGYGYGDEVLPTKGCIYTIRENNYREDVATVRLVEIVNKVREYLLDNGMFLMFEPDFAERRFSPLVERKTDIWCFKAILNTVKQSEHV
jgi:hypothetical protein